MNFSPISKGRKCHYGRNGLFAHFETGKKAFSTYYFANDRLGIPAILRNGHLAISNNKNSILRNGHWPFLNGGTTISAIPGISSGVSVYFIGNFACIYPRVVLSHCTAAPLSSLIAATPLSNEDDVNFETK
jgi:hypothetical protein